MSKRIIGQTGSGKTKGVINMLNKKDYREERSFDKDDRTYRQKKNLCCICRAECLFIGLKNSRGEYKRFCCDCYSKIDIHFEHSLWCKKCNMVNLENIKMKNLNKMYVPISYVVELLQKSCNYSPKMCFIEITNMLQIAKRKKDLA